MSLGWAAVGVVGDLNVIKQTIKQADTKGLMCHLTLKTTKTSAQCEVLKLSGVNSENSLNDC